MIHGGVLGGLGNQLFKIFATISYSIQFNQPFIFFYSKTVNGRRTYWDDFLSNLKKYTINENQMIIPLQNNFIPIGTCMHHYENLPPAEPNKNYSLQNYLQSYKYFEKNEKIIYDLIGWNEQRELVKKKYLNYFLTFCENENEAKLYKERLNEVLIKKIYVTSIHFRFGDYKHVQYCHNLLPLEYYIIAIKNVIDKFFINLSNFSESSVGENEFCENEVESNLKDFSEQNVEKNQKEIRNKMRFLYFYEKEDESIVNIIINKLNIFTEKYIQEKEKYLSFSTVINPSNESVEKTLFYEERNKNETINETEFLSSSTLCPENPHKQDLVKNKITNYIEFIPVNTNIPDWEQMLLMSCCNSNIIANSTFSWWGAYSNPNKDKIICFPAIWFGPSLSHNNIDDMFPNTWFKISF